MQIFEEFMSFVKKGEVFLWKKCISVFEIEVTRLHRAANYSPGQPTFLTSDLVAWVDT